MVIGFSRWVKRFGRVEHGYPTFFLFVGSLSWTEHGHLSLCVVNVLRWAEDGRQTLLFREYREMSRAWFPDIVVVENFSWKQHGSPDSCRALFEQSIGMYLCCLRGELEISRAWSPISLVLLINWDEQSIVTQHFCFVYIWTWAEHGLPTLLLPGYLEMSRAWPPNILLWGTLWWTSPNIPASWTACFVYILTWAEHGHPTFLFCADLQMNKAWSPNILASWISWDELRMVIQHSCSVDILRHSCLLDSLTWTEHCHVTRLIRGQLSRKTPVWRRGWVEQSWSGCVSDWMNE